MSSAAALIREARVSAGLTQTAVAARLGATQAAIARLESPDANPTIATLTRVLEATGHRLELAAPRREAHVDEAQIAERLKLTPAERLVAFQASYEHMRKLIGKA